MANGEVMGEGAEILVKSSFCDISQDRREIKSLLIVPPELIRIPWYSTAPEVLLLLHTNKTYDLSICNGSVQPLHPLRKKGSASPRPSKADNGLAQFR